MDQLPVEIIEIILSNNKLDIEDVLNLSSTCSVLRNIILNSNLVWKKKFMTKWPDIYATVESHIEDWYKELVYIFQLRHKTRYVLSKMSPKFYSKVELSNSDFGEWLDILNEHEFNYDYLIYDLITIINNTDPIKSIEVVPVTTPGNKTLRYYAKKVLRYIRQFHLTNIWSAFISQPENKRTLEKGATIIAQWFQPELNIPWTKIAKIFDDIAIQVKEHLQTECPEHPLFNVDQETLDMWRVTNLDDNQWNAKDCKSVLSSMKYVICEKLGFRGNTNEYYIPQNSYINEVLESKQGLPITLAIVYESVGRRLGLNCIPVSSPSHFLLRFSEGRKPHNLNYYIDVFNKGHIIRSEACTFSHEWSRPLLPRATAIEVVERMANNLEVALRDRSQSSDSITMVKSVLEFLLLVNPHDITTIVYLAKLYMTYNMDTVSLSKLLMSDGFENREHAQRVLNMLCGYQEHITNNKVDLLSQNEPNKRGPELKFAVGMVMKHLLFTYKCVICDWDLTCMAALDWQRQMNVEKLTYKSNQPFYSVLVEDGSKRYVAQENLEPTSDTGFLYLNEDVGRHFSHFFETHYVPNAEKEKEYPEDREVRHMFYQKMMFGS